MSIFQTPKQLQGRLAQFLSQAAKKTALLQQLQDQVSDLQQVVEGLPIAMAVGVLQVEAPVLLRVKALILQMPAVPTSFRRHGDHALGRYFPVGDPGPGGGLPVDGFLALNGLKSPGTFFGRRCTTTPGPTGTLAVRPRA